MKNICVLLSACLSLFSCAAGAAPPKPSFPPTDPVPLSLPEKGSLPVDATVAGLPVTLRGGAVIISAENNDNLKHVDLEKDALTPFTAVLRAYPSARTVELSWFEPITLSATGADVLYDRVKHTVTVDWNDGGGMDPQITGRVQFSHVQESAFAAILRAHSKSVPQDDVYSESISEKHGNNAAAWGGFQFLYQPRYGCRLVSPHKRRHLRRTAH